MTISDVSLRCFVLPRHQNSSWRNLSVILFFWCRRKTKHVKLRFYFLWRWYTLQHKQVWSSTYCKWAEIVSDTERFLYLFTMDLRLCILIRKSSILSLSLIFSLLSISTLDSETCSWCSVWRSLSVSDNWSNVFVCSSLFNVAKAFLENKTFMLRLTIIIEHCIYVQLSFALNAWNENTMMT